jgi:hypothetical protein
MFRSRSLPGWCGECVGGVAEAYQQPLLQVWMVIPSRDKLGKQLGNSGGSFTIAGYDYSPLQIFSKRFVANVPLAERRRFWLTDLNNGPVACQGNGPLRMKEDFLAGKRL